MRFDLIVLLVFLLCIAASDYKRVVISRLSIITLTKITMTARNTSTSIRNHTPTNGMISLRDMIWKTR